MNDSAVQELLDLNQKLLDSIAAADWEVYQGLCHPSLTAFEPEARGQLIEGMDFHRFYFQFGGARGPHHTTMCSPRVRLLGDVAVVTFVRLNQRRTAEGTPTTSAFEETRVWHREGGSWKLVHFHRSAIQ